MRSQVTVLFTVLILTAMSWSLPSLAAPQNPPPAEPPPETSSAPVDEFSRGTVLQVLTEETREAGGAQYVIQVLRVRLLSGPERGKNVRAEYSVTDTRSAEQRVRAGDTVVLAKSLSADGTTVYDVVDRFRLPPLLIILALFVGCVIAFSRTRGLMAVLGLGISIVVLARFVVPRILAGGNPLLVTLAGALVIALTSIYLAHGFSRRTSVALVGMLITLTLAAVLAIVFVDVAHLFGTGSEEAIYLQIGGQEILNLRGLLLGGILLGALGVLDDITTAQAAAVDEISRANPSLSRRGLYLRGLSVGREHITALVNTLVLAYAGASLPLFILFTQNADQPLWVTLNSEFVAEEVVRTLVGSLALTLAVPITTALAAHFLCRSGGRPEEGVQQSHPGHSRH